MHVVDAAWHLCRPLRASHAADLTAAPPACPPLSWPASSTPLSAAFDAWLGAGSGLLRAAATTLMAPLNSGSPWVLVAALTVLTLGVLSALTHWLSLAG